MKACSKCEVVKASDEFYELQFKAKKPRGDGRRSECKSCANASAVEHQKKHKERYKGYTEAHKERNPGIQALYVGRWQQKNPEAVAHDRFMRRLRDRNLTIDQYHAIAEKQDFLCAICGEEPRHQPDAHKRVYSDSFVIDHDHVTDTVRGLVCQTCNVALGMLKDSPVVARAAAAYLDKHHARRAISAPATLSGDNGPAPDTAGNYVPVLSTGGCTDIAATACGVS